LERIREVAVPILEKKGIKIFGMLPENLELRAPTVREICERIKVKS